MFTNSIELNVIGNITKTNIMNNIREIHIENNQMSNEQLLMKIITYKDRIYIFTEVELALISNRMRTHFLKYIVKS